MAAFETHRPVAAPAAGIISSFVVRAFGALQTWNDERITRKALSKLTARELEDIGLTYADVDTIGTIVR